MFEEKNENSHFFFFNLTEIEQIRGQQLCRHLIMQKCNFSFRLYAYKLQIFFPLFDEFSHFFMFFFPSIQERFIRFVNDA